MSKKWSLNDVPALTGRVVVVTGGNSGLGYESVKAFSKNGAKVIMTSRSMERGEAARDRMGDVSGSIDIRELDLMDLGSVRSFAAGFSANYNRIDVLLNNAGIMATPYAKTKDGFEAQMGTNHLGHFALTGLLLDPLRNTPGARVVNVSSNAHKYGTMDFEDLLFDNGEDYTPIKAYSRSKLANLLFTYELDRRLKSIGEDIISVAAHPGVAVTNLASHFEDKWWFKLLLPIAKLMMQTQAQGALPQIRACVDPEVVGGTYYGPNGFRQASGDPVVVQSNAASHDQEDAEALWKMSEELTGVKYL